MSGKRSRDKGARVERGFVELHKALGLAGTHRVPLSGAVENYKGDLRIPIRDRVLSAEVKARGNGEGFKTLMRWLGENHLIFLKQDRTPAMVVLPWETWAWLVGVNDDQDDQGEGTVRPSVAGSEAAGGG